MEGRERELFDLLEPAITRQGVVPVEIGLSGNRRGTIVRVVIHGPDGVSHGDCARVTRACQEALDESGALGSDYTLEVSSPGTTRVLRDEREFEIFRGLPVQVRMKDGTRDRTGFCAGRQPGEGVVLREEDGTESVIPWPEVAKARLAVVPGSRRKAG